jgi:hypothetical protein
LAAAAARAGSIAAAPAARRCRLLLLQMPPRCCRCQLPVPLPSGGRRCGCALLPLLLVADGVWCWHAG